MIQRIQTLYLFIAALLMGLATFLPLADFYGAGGGAIEELEMTAFGIRSVNEGVMTDRTIGMGIVFAVAALLPFVAIFFFKNRFAQFRMCASEMVLLVGALVFEVVFLIKINKALAVFESSMYSFKLPFFFPLIAILFVWLAMRGIMKDIKLVKSLDRIR